MFAFECDGTYRCTIFMHRMTEFMVFGITSEEETFLTHIKVETFQAAIAEAYNWIFLADVALCL